MTMPRRVAVVASMMAACARAPDAPPATVASGLAVTAASARGEAGDALGAGVARVGDLDGDGFEDVAIGLPGYGSGRGRVIIVRGALTGFGGELRKPLDGPAAGSRFGASVAFLGDVDGDGRGDLAVGLPSFSHPEPAEGAVIVYRDGLVERWRFESNTSGLGFGTRVVAAGDVDNSGSADLLVLAVDSGGAGRVSLFRSIVSHNGPGALETTASWTVAGLAVAGAGDIDGDFYDDVVVGDADGCRVYLGTDGGELGIEPRRTHVGPGQTVAMLGDIDGDGRADYACGNAAAAAGLGHVQVHFGDETKAPLDLDGATLGVRGLGRAVAPAGDFDADGLADVVFGADGEALVLTGAFVNPLSYVAWHGRCPECSPAAAFGEVVAPVGDVDGDGFGDVAIGAPALDFLDAPAAGAVELHRGAAGKPRSEPLVVLSTPHYEAPRDLRQAVTIQGDVDGDGRCDLLHGRPSSPSPTGVVAAGAAGVVRFPGGPGTYVEMKPTSATEAGRHLGASVAFVDVANEGLVRPLIGSPGYPWTEVAGAGAADIFGLWFVVGDDEGAHAGAAVAATGDTDGDGYHDWLVGIPGARAALSSVRVGRVRLFAGGRRTTNNGLWVPTVSERWDALGDIEGGELGAAAAGVGDLDGDGLGDVVVGQPGADRVWVVRGTRGAWAHETLAGPVSGERFGAAVAAAGDVDGDGLGDVLFGAPEADDGRGKVYVYRQNLGIRTLVAGGAAGDQRGYSVASAGDLDLDGFADIVIGEPGFDGPAGVDAGRVSVFRGSRDGLVLEPWWTVDGDRPGASLGDVVVGGGDLDGDGVGDLVLGARDLTPDNDSAQDAQRLFIFRGRGPAPSNREPRPYARQVGDPTPITPGGASRRPDAFTVQVRAASPFGPGKVALEVVAEPVAFAASPVVVRSGWTDYRGDTVALSHEVPGLPAATAWSWRARILFDPARATPQAASRWFHGGVPGQPSRVHVRTRDNAAPLVFPDAYRCVSDVGLDVSASGVATPGLLANDRDPDLGDQLSVTLGDGTRSGRTAYGSITVRDDGGFTYRPDAGFAGADSFVYRASDGVGGSATAAVEIVVVPAGCDVAVVDACRAGSVSATLALDIGTRAIRCHVVGSGAARTLDCDTDRDGDLVLTEPLCDAP